MYTIRLIALDCFTAEELDGDEIYIKLNAAKIWEARPDKMSHALIRAAQVREYDFAQGRKLTHAGWLAMDSFRPEDFAFPNEDGRSVLQLWDADALTRDDLLGETPIDAAQAGGGNISVVFRRSGAHYRLTYKVEVQG
ncbi:MAG TPA: hypothetical protein VHD90_06865 [Phototrophicaceae bacterium]|nr:hypothetical protein [Phototrophicaceae bacterium]